MKLRQILTLLVPAIFFMFSLTDVHAQGRPTKKRPRLSKARYNGVDTIDRKSVFLSYPTNFVASTLKIGYESKLVNNKSLALIGALGGADASNQFYGVNSFTEVGLEAQFRVYVLKDRPTLNGLYLGPYLGFKSMTYSSTDPIPPYNNWVTQNYTVSDFMLGYIIGYQYILGNTLTFNAFIGGGDNFISGDNSKGTVNQNPYGYPKGIAIHTGIGLGIAF